MNKFNNDATGAEDLSIAVLGLGHVGLPTALGLAELGWSVTGSDNDPNTVRNISLGKPSFYEPGIRESLQKHLDMGTFSVEPCVPSTIQSANVIFVCVNTPQNKDGSADLTHLEEVAIAIASNHNGYTLVVEKSTTPVQTAHGIKNSINRHMLRNHSLHPTGNQDMVELAVNPEFLQEGSALQDFLHPNRVVIGVESDRARSILLQIYQPLLALNQSSADEMLLLTDINTAEIIKHASNSFLATKISFINMVSNLCESTGANIMDVAKGIGLDPRIGSQFLEAGIGYGGYCLPKDIKAFTWIAAKHGVDFSLLEEVDRINKLRVSEMLNKLRQALVSVEQQCIALWGLSFKPQTDDVRESPSIQIVSNLLKEKARVRLYDPVAMDQFRLAYPENTSQISYHRSPEDAAQGANAILVATAWQSFLDVDFKRVREQMQYPLIIDGRNLFNPDDIRSVGFKYHSIGRP